jgi:acetylornithine deacetylase
VDVRTNGLYSNLEVLEVIKYNAGCELEARSLRLNSSSIKMDHPVVVAAKNMGINLYGSPTSSDQAIIPYPSIKIGPGDSARSHTANEYIYPDEIRKGIEIYIKLLENLEFGC